MFGTEEEIITGNSTTEYTIKDEDGRFVHRNSIRKIGKIFYYLSYESLKDGCIVYTNKARVEEALNNLELHNQLGNLGHNFTIISV